MRRRAGADGTPISSSRQNRKPAVAAPERPAPPPPLSPSPRLLLGPGPSEVHPRVLAAMGMPLLGHLDPEFVALMDETQNLLRYTFQTENRLTLAVSGTGSAGGGKGGGKPIEPRGKKVVCGHGGFCAPVGGVA